MALLFAFLWLWTAHFLADFVLQTHWMASNKSKDNWALTCHVMMYSVVMAFAIVPVAVALGIKPGWLGVWVIGNAALHFATDYVTSRLSSKKWGECFWDGSLVYPSRLHDFFVVIGFDQVVHAWCLGLTLAWLVS